MGAKKDFEHLLIPSSRDECCAASSCRPRYHLRWKGICISSSLHDISCLMPNAYFALVAQYKGGHVQLIEYILVPGMECLRATNNTKWGAKKIMGRELSNDSPHITNNSSVLKRKERQINSRVKYDFKGQNKTPTWWCTDVGSSLSVSCSGLVSKQWTTRRF